MVQGYEKFNESRKNKGGRNNRNAGNHQNSWKNEVPRFAPKPDIIGDVMDFSERFKYVINKIAEKNNPIAKELINLPNKPDTKFQQSYLDLTGSGDMISYLSNFDVPDGEKYKTIKRQSSKVYKTIKNIFGSKYTSPEVKKFVSIFKQIYTQGPDKSETHAPKQTKEQLLKKIINDTKIDKLKWNKISKYGNMNKYSVKIKITDKKYLIFDFFHFDEDENSLMTINMHNDVTKKSTWVNTLPFQDLSDFLKVFKEKYKIDVK